MSVNTKASTRKRRAICARPRARLSF